MPKPTILKITLILVHILLGLSVFLIIIVLLGTVFWHISPESFHQAELLRGFKAGYGIGDVKLHIQKQLNRSDGVFLSDLSYGMFYWLVIRALIFIGLNIMGLLKLRGILKSIEDVRTFYDTNITNLHAIGRYAIIAAVLSFFNISNLLGQWSFHFSIPFGPLIIALIAFVLAEVFTEGKLLLEDKNMIV